MMFVRMIDTGEVGAGQSCEALTKKIQEVLDELRKESQFGLSDVKILHTETLHRRPSNSSYWRDRLKVVVLFKEYGDGQ